MNKVSFCIDFVIRVGKRVVVCGQRTHQVALIEV